MFDILNKLKINSKRLELLGDANDKRDFIYVTDAIRAIYLAAEHPNNHGATINIGTGQATSIDHVVQNICEILSLNPVITYTGNSWQGNVQIFYSDPSKLMSYDWKSSYTLNDGLKLLTSWYENTFGKIK
jgi:nucleoside-diphosphate-sugar epimerase